LRRGRLKGKYKAGEKKEPYIHCGNEYKTLLVKAGMGKRKEGYKELHGGRMRGVRRAKRCCGGVLWLKPPSLGQEKKRK